MITKYNNFTEKLNEADGDFRGNKGGKLWGSIKNLFNKLLQNISDELKKPIDELTNKLSKTKDTKQIKNIIINFLKLHSTNLDNLLKDIKTLSDLKKFTEDNLRAIYASIKAQISSLRDENYTFEKIFADSPSSVKKLFVKDEKMFDKSVNQFAVNLVNEQAKKLGYTDEQLNESFKLFEELEGEGTEGGNEEGTDTGNEEGTDTGNEEGTDTGNEAPADEQTKEIEDAQTKEEDKKEEPQKDDSFTQLKDSINKWFDIGIYKKLDESLKGTSNTKQNTGGIEDKIKNMETTNYKDNINKMMDAITKVDKEKLLAIRNLLGFTKEDTPL